MCFRLRNLAGILAIIATLFAACDGADRGYTDFTTTPPSSTLRGSPTTQARSPTSTPACTAPYPTGMRSAEDVFCADPSPMEQARVVRIIDGDTMEVELRGRMETVRIYGIDTPERGEVCFREAAERLEELSAGEVRLSPGDRERDRFDRLLRYVYAPDGSSIDALLVSEGLATAWTTDGDLRFALIELEGRARANGAGCLWRR